jgi:hypothetical protein
VEPAPRRRAAFLAGRGRSWGRPAMSDERVREMNEFFATRA